MQKLALEKSPQHPSPKVVDEGKRLKQPDHAQTSGSARVRHENKIGHRAYSGHFMPNAIAFFPWTYIDEPRTFGPFQAHSVLQGRLPGDQPNVTQIDIDGVLGAYANRPNKPVERSVCLSSGSGKPAWTLNQAQVAQLFRARNLVAFSALLPTQAVSGTLRLLQLRHLFTGRAALPTRRNRALHVQFSPSGRPN